MLDIFQRCPTCKRLLGTDIEKPTALIDTLLPKEVIDYLGASGYWLPKASFPVRAALVLLTSRRYGASAARQVTMGAAMEMIHCASLLHERLGNISGSTLHGCDSSGTTHQMESMDVLLGDFFFARAAALIIADGDRDVIEDMLTTSLRSAEVQAQVLSLDTEGPVPDLDEHFGIVSGKCSLMLSLSTRVGAWLGKAPETERRVLSCYGEVLGRTMQIVEDVQLWRSVAQGVMRPPLEPMLTYPLLLLRSEYGKEATTETTMARSTGAAQLEKLCSVLFSRGYVDRSIARAQEYAEQACRHLEAVGYSEEIEALEEIAHALCSVAHMK